MNTRKADPHRLIAASARVMMWLTPTAVTRLAALAAIHHLTRAAMARAAIEAYVDSDQRDVPLPAGPPPPPERTTVLVPVRVMPETRAAVEALAVRTTQTKTAIVREALNAMAADSGVPPLFAPVAHRQRWPGISRRCHIGLHRSYRPRRERREDDE